MHDRTVIRHRPSSSFRMRTARTFRTPPPHPHLSFVCWFSCSKSVWYDCRHDFWTKEMQDESGFAFLYSRCDSCRGKVGERSHGDNVPRSLSNCKNMMGGIVSQTLLQLLIHAGGPKGRFTVFAIYRAVPSMLSPSANFTQRQQRSRYRKRSRRARTFYLRVTSYRPLETLSLRHRGLRQL
jgi:hypothetical protein